MICTWEIDRMRLRNILILIYKLITMALYINLTQLMKEKWINALKLSKLTWLTPEHISVIKRGKTSQIKLDTIEKLIIAFEIEPNQLFTHNPPPKKWKKQ